MINLYSPTNTDFTHNGNATLQAISCELTVNINGAWQLELEIPYDKEERWKLIEEGAILQVDVDCIREISTRQRFRIYDYRKTEDSVIAIAFPVAMESTHDAPIDNLIIEDKSGIQAMAMLQAFTNKYTLYTDITKRGNASYSNTNVNNAIASGDTGSFIDEWGGEIVYDNLNYKVLEQIGSETDVEPVTYGRNITAIKYERDDSGVVTRLHPISQDGLRLNDNGHDYVDSPRILDYPIVKSRYISVPYTLLEDRIESPSRTAQFTRQMETDITSYVSTLSHTAYANALDDGYEVDYIKMHLAELVDSIQQMALGTIVHEEMREIMLRSIANGMEWLKSEVKPPYDWHGSYASGWWYGYDCDWKDVDKYDYIGGSWNKFDDMGYWIEAGTDKEAWDWYQPVGATNIKYGNFNRWYARNEWIYQYTDQGQTLWCYWLDAGGWCTDNAGQQSTWTWHESSVYSGLWWFGAEGATAEDPNSFIHDAWAYINGYRYYFDHDGYNSDTVGLDKIASNWHWITTDNVWWWFGDTNHETDAIYLADQWAKIGNEWHYFGADGYLMADETALANMLLYFRTEMSALTAYCLAENTAAYNLLYSLMIEYCNKQYDSDLDLPTVNIDVNMLDLSKTSEYKDYQQLAKICLGDKVLTKDYEHDISATERVIGLTYDCIRKYNTKVEIGAASSSFVNILKTNASGEVEALAFDTSGIEDALQGFSDEIGSLDLRKQDKLRAGANISIVNNVISAITGGGGGGGGGGDGSTIRYGLVAPSDSLGDDGDLYVKLKVAEVHDSEYKTRGAVYESNPPAGYDYSTYWHSEKDNYTTYYGSYNNVWESTLETSARGCRSGLGVRLDPNEQEHFEEGREYTVSFWLQTQNMYTSDYEYADYNLRMLLVADVSLSTIDGRLPSTTASHPLAIKNHGNVTYMDISVLNTSQRSYELVFSVPDLRTYYSQYDGVHINSIDLYFTFELGVVRGGSRFSVGAVSYDYLVNLYAIDMQYLKVDDRYTIAYNRVEDTLPTQYRSHCVETAKVDGVSIYAPTYTLGARYSSGEWIAQFNDTYIYVPESSISGTLSEGTVIANLKIFGIEGTIRAPYATAEVINNYSQLDGTEIATINGDSLYAPSIGVSNLLGSGTRVATISIAGTGYDIKVPNVQIQQLLSTGSAIAEINNVTLKNGIVANPSETASETLTKIGIAGTTYDLPSGGSTVEISQLMTSGTQIAVFTVDGDTYRLRAPSVSISQTQTSGTEIAKINNTSIYAPTIEANPSGTASGTLTKLGINGTVYSISGGGGGADNYAGYVSVDMTTALDGNPPNLNSGSFNKNVVQTQLTDMSGNTYAITEAGLYELKVVASIHGSSALSSSDASEYIGLRLSGGMSGSGTFEMTALSHVVKTPAILFNGETLGTQLEQTILIKVTELTSSALTPTVVMMAGGNLATAYNVTLKYQANCRKLS